MNGQQAPCLQLPAVGALVPLLPGRGPLDGQVAIAMQFERTLIIAEDDSQVSYLEGCTAPSYDTNQVCTTPSR